MKLKLAKPSQKRLGFFMLLLISALAIAATLGSPTFGLLSSKPATSGSSSNFTFRATGFFHTAFDGKRWWIVTPDGHPFYISGVDHVDPAPDVDRVTNQCPYCIAIAS
ncbi:MAG: hypothetical protein HKL80_05560 [Acidimicrobiales bacterium]|nr:hypothetical protein [Acidimicrobiales bacterium]